MAPRSHGSQPAHRRRSRGATSWRAAVAVSPAAAAAALLPPPRRRRLAAALGLASLLAAAALLLAAVAAPAAAQPWGVWLLGPGAFGDWRWLPPVALAADLPATDPDGAARLVLTGPEAGFHCHLAGAWQPCGGTGETEPHAPTHGAAGSDPVTITEAQISDLDHTVDTGPVPDCTGTDAQLADGACVDVATQAELAAWDTTADDLSDDSIDALDDVDTTTVPPDPADVLAWDGADWTPAAIPPGALPAGADSELQYRADATTFGALPDSSAGPGGDVTLGGGIRTADFSDAGGMAYGFVTGAGEGIWNQPGTGLHIRAAGQDQLTLTSEGARVNKTLYLMPTPTPPVTCGASKFGYSYTDDSGADCWCNGSAWTVRTGGGTCS